VTAMIHLRGSSPLGGRRVGMQEGALTREGGATAHRAAAGQGIQVDTNDESN